MKKFGKRDILLLSGVLVILIGIWLVMLFGGAKNGSYITITVDGEFYGKYDLNVSREIAVTVEGITTNYCIISDGKADMTEAECPDQLCVQQRAISKNGESIVCLPNKVVIAVEGGEESAIDSIAR